MKKKSLVGIAFLLIAVTLNICSCYYDKEELLYPDTACDTAIIRYSSTVQPVLNSFCVSCHGGATPSAGIKLDTYTGVSIQVANGRLFGAISHSANFSPMPKNSSKLSNCNIAKIRKWIDDGYPNN